VELAVEELSELLPPLLIARLGHETEKNKRKQQLNLLLLPFLSLPPPSPSPCEE
jgi:hypothetical protein